jgi:hypothetical protein
MPKTRGAKSSSPQDSPGGGGAGEGQASSSSLPSPAPAPEAEPEEGDFEDAQGDGGVDAATQAAIRAASAEALAESERLAALGGAQLISVARASVSDLKASLGKVLAPGLAQVSSWRSGLTLLAASDAAEDIDLFSSAVQASGINPRWGTPPGELVDLVLAEEVKLRPPPPPVPETPIERALRVASEQQLGVLNAFRAEQAAAAAAAAEQSEQLRAECAALRDHVQGQDAELEKLRREVKAKSVSKEDNPFEIEPDDRLFVKHYKSDEADASGVVRLNPHQDPPRPLGTPFKPHLLPGLDRSPLGKELNLHGAPEAWAEYVVLKSS